MTLGATTSPTLGQTYTNPTTGVVYECTKVAPYPAWRIVPPTTSGSGAGDATILQSTTLTTPPASPATNAMWYVPAGATGIWSTHIGTIAKYDGAAWSYTALVNGDIFWDEAANALYTNDNGTLKASGGSSFTALTGPVTSSASGGATAVTANAITHAMLVQMPAATIAGNKTAAIADRASLTMPDVATLLTADTTAKATLKTALLSGATSDGIVSSAYAPRVIPGSGTVVTGLAYGAGIWVMTVTTSTGQATLSSTDFTTWTVRDSGAGAAGSVRFANGRFIFGRGNVIKWSSDGITWTAGTGTNAGQNNVNFVWLGGNEWVSAGATSYQYSTDNGSTWTFAAFGANITDVIKFGGVYCFCAASGTYSAPALGGTLTARAGISVNFATNGTVLTNGVAHTTNGITWTTHATISTSYLPYVMYFTATSTFGLICSAGVPGWVSSSADGLTFAAPRQILARAIDSSSPKVGIANGMLTFAAKATQTLASAESITVAVSLTSADGLTWNIGAIDATGGGGFAGYPETPKRVANAGGIDVAVNTMLILA
jgi:hypothetical protein